MHTYQNHRIVTFPRGQNSLEFHAFSSPISFWNKRKYKYELHETTEGIVEVELTSLAG
jgi:hypothetical protein